MSSQQDIVKNTKQIQYIREICDNRTARNNDTKVCYTRIHGFALKRDDRQRNKTDLQLAYRALPSDVPYTQKVLEIEHFNLIGPLKKWIHSVSII